MGRVERVSKAAVKGSEDGPFLESGPVLGAATAMGRILGVKNRSIRGDVETRTALSASPITQWSRAAVLQQERLAASKRTAGAGVAM
jgi:hypothetical protein